MPLGPSSIRRAKRSVIGFAVFTNALWDDFLTWKQHAMPEAYEVIAGCTRGSTIAFYEWMNPIQSPKRICWQCRGVGYYRPILMNDGEESVHFLRDVFEVRWNVISYVNWFLSIPTAELRDVRYRCVIQAPKGVFVERLDAFFYTNFNAVGK